MKSRRRPRENGELYIKELDSHSPIKNFGDKFRGKTWIPVYTGINMSYWLTNEHENIIFPLWKRGMKGDFKINEFIKSPLTPSA